MDLITSHMLELGNDRFLCAYCNFESHDRVIYSPKLDTYTTLHPARFVDICVSRHVLH